MTNLIDKAAVKLRALEMKDLGNCYKWHNDPELYMSLGSTFRPVSLETEREWLTRKQAYNASELNLAICIQENDQHIGNIYLRSIDWIARNAELHIFIGSVEYRGKGYGTQAVQWLINYAFSYLGLRRLYLFVLADNQPAISMYNKCGFQSEGYLVGHYFKNGVFRDVAVMGIVAKTNHSEGQ